MVSRAKEEELLYVLRKILELRLWSGSLWAALSNKPTEYCINQPGIDNQCIHLASPNNPTPAIGAELPIPKNPKDLIADSVKRSTVAHLFHFYPVLCEIASIPRGSPSEIRGAIAIQQSHSGRKEKNGVIPEREVSKSELGEELDARTVARRCLKEVGREIGVA